MLKKILVIIVALLALAAVYFNYGKQPPKITEGISAQQLKSGPYAVTTLDIDLVDETRKTQANGDFAGANTRTIKTRIWYPKSIETLGKVPLLIYNHGFSSSRLGGAHIAQHLASKGYIVAAGDFPLTNISAPGGPLILDVVNQPGDISFIIDQLLEWNSNDESVFFGHVDSARIGIAGLSLGGLTSTLAAFHPDLMDERIALVVSIAGPAAPFGPRFYEHRADLPTLMLAAPEDALVTYADNALAMKRANPNAELVTIEGGSHTGFSAQSTLFRFMNNPDSLACELVMSNLGNDLEGKDWTDLLGGEEMGLVANAGGRDICTMNPLPKAMNPVRQQWLTVLAVGSFVESYFAESEQQRLANRQYFETTMSAEIPELNVQLKRKLSLRIK